MNIRRLGTATAALAAGTLALVTMAACSTQPTTTGQAGAAQSTAQSGAPAANQGISGAGATVGSGSGGTGTGGSGGTGPTTAGGGPGATVAGHTTSQCGASTLTLSLGQGDTSMSQTHLPLHFVNRGSAPCVIVGFPGVSYVTGDNGQQVGPPAQRDGAVGKPITLAPGQTATTIVDSVTVGVFDANVCQPTAVRGFRVYAPDDRASMFVALPSGFQGCQGNTPSPQLRLTTLTAG